MIAERFFNPDSEIIAGLMLFEDAAPESVHAILERARVWRAAPGEQVIAPDVRNSTVFVILRGTLRVDLVDGDSGTHTHVGPGECVGELSVIDGANTSATVRAVDECELLALDGEAVLMLVERSHPVARNLLRLLTRRLRGSNTALRAEARQSDTLRRQATVDSLTGLFSRAWLDDTLARLCRRNQHGAAPFGLAMCDLDYFKAFNDRWGHLVGDQVLQRVGAALQDCLRPPDFAARYGGEELAFVLAGARGIDDAHHAAERIRRAVGDLVLMLEHGQTLPPISISIGVAVSRPGDTREALIRRADQALYRAKHAGRDRVERETPVD